MTNATQDQIDRAREWANEWAPDAAGDETSAEFAAIVADIAECDIDDTMHRPHTIERG